ncbi:MAG: hypothetical protein E4G98_03115 [Promethearchaeota archaeon]|nr:MAG: hypothetical protein E4G98_03115 [Candidatus Lokiarchaeota archaeon]
MDPKPKSLKQSQKIDFHTKIWPQDHQLLKKLSLKYGNIQNVIEEAIHLLKVRESLLDEEIMQTIIKHEIDLYPLSHLMLQDFRMVSVGRRTFLSLIQNLPETPIQENNALELIEWFYNDVIPIKNLTLYQVLAAIRNLWISGNYFTKINIQSTEEDVNSSETIDIQHHHSFKIVFYHDFNDQTYGEYWTKYFTYFLSEQPLNYHVSQIVIRPQSFYFVVELQTLQKS